MEWATLTSLMEKFIWPAAFVAVAIFFRKEIRLALVRVIKAKLPGGTEISFGRTIVDDPVDDRGQAPSSSTIQSVDWSKVGNLYWLANDVMWTRDALLRGAPRVKILHGLRQSLHHATKLGLHETTSGRMLKTLNTEFADAGDGEIPRDERERIAILLRRISAQFGAIAETRQPDFESGF